MSFSQALASNDWLLADGATGTNLFAMGLEAGDAPELWNTDKPETITKLYQLSVDAGSDVFLTNSFGGTAARLKLHNAQNRVGELNRVAAELARDVADRADRKVYVAGSVGPTGELLEPVGPLTHEAAVEMFHEQAQALKDGGVDVLWVETISSAEEFRAAAEAFARVDMPWCGTMSFDTAGRTMMGVTAPMLSQMIRELDHKPLAYGANCGTGASDLVRTLQGFDTTHSAVISKGNAGIPKYVDGHICYDGTPDLMADYAVMAYNSGATLIGGCCGTRPEHLVKMRAALEATSGRKAPPSLTEIEAALGSFSSKNDGTEADAPAPRARRTRRRTI